MEAVFCLDRGFCVCFYQESVKVSDLNPNAKAWANHVFSLDHSGSAVTTTSALQPWKEGCDRLADSSQGLLASLVNVAPLRREEL